MSTKRPADLEADAPQKTRKSGSAAMSTKRPADLEADAPQKTRKSGFYKKGERSLKVKAEQEKMIQVMNEVIALRKTVRQLQHDLSKKKVEQVKKAETVDKTMEDCDETAQKVEIDIEKATSKVEIENGLSAPRHHLVSVGTQTEGSAGHEFFVRIKDGNLQLGRHRRRLSSAQPSSPLRSPSRSPTRRP
jgi:hypothetical protein